MCIGREDDTNILSYVDFSRLCNVMLGFPEFSTDFSTNGITFTLSYSERAMKWRKTLFMV